MMNNRIWLQKFLEFVASRHKIALEEYRKGLPVHIFLDPSMAHGEKGMAITNLNKRRVGAVVHINPELNWGMRFLFCCMNLVTSK